MSSPAASAGHHHADENKFQIYVQIAMLLAVITGIEIVIIFIPFATWLIVSSLVVLSVVKFLYVIFYFMHLKWDKAFCTILFFIGLVLATGTTWALLEIFDAKDSIPLTAQES
ncbi:MAG: cytochrome C oxidase subunit IV family protein [Opitutaceae bacterium]|nr:cytochrome C oxidase subunit IV family protein [Cephaloticoccus sp.]MCP5529946.1 cytochrome C oxidase subunit IV family protein [Opitutaceae bacterium]